MGWRAAYSEGEGRSISDIISITYGDIYSSIQLYDLAKILPLWEKVARSAG
jgi:hypothetical protein